MYLSSVPICFLIASRMLHTMNTLSTTDKAESIRLKTLDISLLRRIGTAITLDINPKSKLIKGYYQKIAMYDED